MNAVIRNQAEEGRLFELRGEALTQGAVEDGVARGVDEVGEDDGVFFGELCEWMRPPVEGRDRDDEQNACGRPQHE